MECPQIAKKYFFSYINCELHLKIPFVTPFSVCKSFSNSCFFYTFLNYSSNISLIVVNYTVCDNYHQKGEEWFNGLWQNQRTYFPLPVLLLIGCRTLDKTSYTPLYCNFPICIIGIEIILIRLTDQKL